jgi:hypothetical protein
MRSSRGVDLSCDKFILNRLVVIQLERHCLKDDEQSMNTIVGLDIILDIYLHNEVIVGLTEPRAISGGKTSVIV